MGDKPKDQKSDININDPQSPSYLCASNNLGNVICHVIFTGDNYAKWSRLVINALKSKNKLMFVDGPLTQPEINSPEGHAWERCNSMVLAWLHNVIDKGLHGSVAYIDIVEELWSDLKDRYSQSNELCIHQLKRNIALTNQDTLSVTEYFTKLKMLWDELGAYPTLPNCNCTKDFNLNRFVERERVHQFLMLLDTEKFETVRLNLLTMEPLPTVNKAYAVVHREERQQFLAKGVENKMTVEASEFKASTNKPSKPNWPRWTHCQKLGHDRSQCFEIVGYPQNWQGRRQKQAGQGGLRLGDRNSGNRVWRGCRWADKKWHAMRSDCESRQNSSRSVHRGMDRHRWREGRSGKHSLN